MAKRGVCPQAELTVSGRSIVRHFETLSDPRQQRNRRHLLVDVITIVVCGVIVGCDRPTSIRQWAKAKEEWLKQFLELPNGLPSRDCIRRVLTALKPEAFQEKGYLCDSTTPYGRGFRHLVRLTMVSYGCGATCTACCTRR